MIVLIVGLPGTGKTTFAKALANKFDAIHLNSDIIRISLGQQGQYDFASKLLVYRELRNKTEKILQQGNDLVVDATLYKNILREPFQKLAKQFNIPIKWIELKADESTIKQRVSKKRKHSEADFWVYLKVKAIYEPLSQNHMILWSDVLSLDEMVDKAQEYIQLGEISSK